MSELLDTLFSFSNQSLSASWNKTSVALREHNVGRDGFAVFFKLFMF